MRGRCRSIGLGGRLLAAVLEGCASLLVTVPYHTWQDHSDGIFRRF
jgi:hypothetical protein